MTDKNNKPVNDQSTVFDSEIILSLLVKECNANPVRLGIGFFIAVPLLFTVWSIVKEYTATGHRAVGYITYIENISWSFSMFYLFPFILALTLVYYRAIPDLFFNRLIGKDKVVVPASGDDFLEKYKEDFFKQFNQPWIPVASMLIAITMSIVYVSKVGAHNSAGWMFQSGNLTTIGAYAIIVQCFLGYWMLNLLFRALVFSRLLNELFNDDRFSVNLNPIHEDNACGLRSIFQVTTILNIVLFLAGIYLSLNVIDKLVIQEVGFSIDIVSPIMLATYALTAPLLFFLPLWAPHNAMLKEKQKFVAPVCRQLEDSLRSIRERHKCDESKITLLTQLREERLNLLKQIPVWPFDIKSLNAFFGAVIMPVVPTVLPFIVNSISNM
jgi:hypothetical protein